MVKTAIRFVVALALVAVGWNVGRAQTAAPDFEMKLGGGAGADVWVQCVRGCRVMTVDSRPVEPSRAVQGRNIGGACADKAPCTFTVAGWAK
jgi:hypothetical protein